jgi:glycosyltransferase involved in cell wall biosynthesis
MLTLTNKVRFNLFVPLQLASLKYKSGKHKTREVPVQLSSDINLVDSMPHQFLNTETVSIIIPAYNCAQFIDECIKSVLAQSWSNLEIIIINDGSTDGTDLIIGQYSAINDRIVVVNNRVSCGASHARNQGINIAVGAYLFFLDADDWLHPSAIEALVNSMQQGHVEFVIGGHLQVRQQIHPMYFGYQHETTLNTNQLFQYIKQYLARPYRHVMLVHCWGRLYRHEIIKSQQIRFNESLSQLEDLHFNFQYIQKIKSLTFIPNGFYYHRILNNQNSMSVQMGLDNQTPVSAEIAFNQVKEYLLSNDQLPVEEANTLISKGLASMLIVSIIRLCRKFIQHPNSLVYQKISNILKSTIFQQNLKQLRPQKGEAILLYWSCRTQLPLLVLCAGILRVLFSQYQGQK